MKRGLLYSAATTLLIVAVSVGILLYTTAGLRLLIDVSQSMIPGTLSFDRLDGRLVGPVRVTNLHWQQDGSSLRIEHAAFDWRPLQLGSKHLYIDWLEGTGIDYSQSPSTDPAPAAPLRLPTLPIRITADAANLEQITINVNNTVSNINQVQLSAQVNDESYRITALGVSSDGFEATGAFSIGTAAPYPLSGRLETRGLPRNLGPEVTLQTQLHLDGNLDQVHLTARSEGDIIARLEATVNNPQTRPVIHGQLVTEEVSPLLTGLTTAGLRTQLDFSATAEQVDIQGAITPADLLPAPAKIDGSFRLGPTAVEVITLQLGIDGTALSVNLQGEVDTATGQVDLDSRWQNLQLPLDGSPLVSSPHGRATLQGQIDDYAVSLTASIGNARLPPLDVTATASGNQSGMRVSRIVARTADQQAEHISASGSIDWADGVDLLADFDLRSLDLRRLHPELQGDVNSVGRFSGNFDGPEPRVEIIAERISGQLRQRPLQGKGEMHWTPGRVTLRQVSLDAGDARLRIDGNIGETLALDWAVDIPNLGLLWPAASGSVNSIGEARGTLAAPTASGTLSASRLQLSELQADSVEGQFRARPAGSGVDLEINASAVRLAGLELGEVSSQLVGKPSSHQLDLSISNSKGTLRAQANGDFQASGWRGHLQQLVIDPKNFESLGLQASVPLELGPRRVSITGLCLEQAPSARLCLDGVMAANSNEQLTLQLRSVPLSTFAALLPPGLDYAGDINGDGHLSMAGGRITGIVQVDLGQGQVITREDGDDQIILAYENGRMLIEAEPQQLQASVHMELRDAGVIDANLRMPTDRGGAIDGNVRLNVNNLSMVPALVPQVSRMRGTIEADLQLQGTLQAPDLTGRLSLAASEAILPDFGLNLRDTSITLTTMANEARFDGVANSGDGRLQLNGELRWQDGAPSGKMQLAGENFRALDLPEAWVNASPQLAIVVDNREIDVTGTVLIPAARITPLDIDTGIRASADQEIVGMAPAASDASRWRINGRMELTAGEDVQINAYGLEGRLAGSVLIIDQPGKPTTARGTLEVVDGRYAAYGQELNIETGKLEFTGGTLDDPGLDLRASRTAGDIIAGVQVRGALRQPVVTLYSVPPMGDTQALSYLATGRALEELDDDGQTAVTEAATRLALQGGGSLLATRLGRSIGLDSVGFEDTGTTASTSLVVGKQLSPKLFVSYGIGLFEAINTLRLRYRINRRLTLVTESGERNSADLLYSFER